MYTDNSSYLFANEVVATGLPTVEPSLNYVISTTASTVAAPALSVSAPAGGVVWGAARMSASGTCYGIYDTAAAGTKYTPTPDPDRVHGWGGHHARSTTTSWT